MDMCRFSGPDDVEYRKVAAALQRMTAASPRSPNVSPFLTKEHRQQLRDSLGFDQIDARHMTIKRAHRKTCKWLKTKNEYLDWLNPGKIPEHHGFLWVKGNPGTGKSTLMKFAFDQAQRTMTDKIILSFFFNARGEELEQSTTGMYRSLLLQLLQRLPGLEAIFDSVPLTAWPRGGQIQWSVELLKDLFERAVQNLGRSWVVCFIDALDECNYDQVRDMVSFFERIGELAILSNIQFQVCFSSRHYPYITIAHGLELVLEGQEGHAQDIANYIDSDLKIGHSKDAEEIRAELQAKASGVFMWVVLVVDILNKEHDRGRIHALRKRLREIPAGLHDLFRDILTRDDRDRDELILCLQWVLFAESPLRPEELYFALLAGTDPESLGPWNQELATLAIIQRFIVDSSKGLAETTKSKKTPVVQFIHESVRDFLLKDNGLREIWPDLGDRFKGQSHEKLKECCLKYIRADLVGHPRLSEQLPKASSKDAVDLRGQTQKDFPFLKYAVRGVLYHANEAESEGIVQNGFLKSFPLQEWIYLHNLLEIYEARYHTPKANLLHQAAKNGHLAVAKLLVEAGADKEAQDNSGRTPLYWAAWNGHWEIAKLLIEAGADKEAKDSCGWTPLYRAAASGHSAVAKVLVEADIDKEVKDNGGRTPLHWAARNDHWEIVKMLVEAGADKEAKDDSGQMPLHRAAWNGRWESVKILVEAKADKEAKDNAGWTPLYQAAASGYSDVAKVLIEAGAKKEVKDNGGRTSLYWAARNDHSDVAKVLVEAGVDKEAKDVSGWTPLHWAAADSHWDVVKLLVEAGADKEAKDDSGQTPLHRAAGNSHLAVSKLLIEAGADKEAKDDSGQTPLFWAAWNGHWEIAKLLIEAGADKEAKDDSGQTPLHRAARNGHSAVARLFR